MRGANKTWYKEFKKEDGDYRKRSYLQRLNDANAEVSDVGFDKNGKLQSIVYRCSKEVL